MKKTLLLTGTIFLSSCGSITSYDYPSFSDEAGKYSKGVEVSQKEYTTTFLFAPTLNEIKPISTIFTILS